ncbi:MAG TPA: hypothetical protein VKD28_13790 [Gemmatimonadales bacterium]|nr:hypothetical protein [Gemmatimonadales bacterium]
MTVPNSSASDDPLPPARLVRWVLLAGVILFSVGLYFRFGSNVQPLGTVAPPATTTTP